MPSLHSVRTAHCKHRYSALTYMYHRYVVSCGTHSVSDIHYLRHGGYVFVVVCLFACQQLCAKTSKRICMKFSGKVGNGPVNKILNSGGDPYHRLMDTVIVLGDSSLLGDTESG